MIEKEVRALLPAWTACAIAIIAARYQLPGLVYLGFPAYLVGAAGLGAWSVGHEYAYGTLGSMLALPVPRRRWWIAKLVVLAPSLAALAGLAAWFVVIDRGDRSFGAAIFWVPAVAAFCLAPWLTIAARSALAGAVFTVGLLGGSMALGEWIGVSRYGFTSDVDDFRRAFFVWSLASLSIVGGVAGWRTFAGLQDGGGQERDWQVLGRPTSASEAGLRRRPVLVALVLKELRLQQLAIVVSAVYVIGTLTVLFLRRSDVFGIFEVLMALYVISVPALIGSLACAEERQFGTLDGQLLLPVAAPLQWLVKAATAIALAIVLAVVLPAALGRLLPLDAVHVGPGGSGSSAQTLVIVLGSVGVSLYVSTLARSGMSALLSSIAAIPALAYFSTRVGWWVGYQAFQWVHQARAPHTHHTLVPPGVYSTVESFVVFIIAVVALALPHYRYADRRPGRVAFDAALIAAGIVGYSVAINVVMALRF